MKLMRFCKVLFFFFFFFKGTELRKLVPHLASQCESGTGNLVTLALGKFWLQGIPQLFCRLYHFSQVIQFLIFQHTCSLTQRGRSSTFALENQESWN